MPVDPVKELFWSVVLNGVIAVPTMAVMMLLASRKSTIGVYTIGLRLRPMDWIATIAMALTVGAMPVTH